MVFVVRGAVTIKGAVTASITATATVRVNIH